MKGCQGRAKLIIQPGPVCAFYDGNTGEVIYTHSQDNVQPYDQQGKGPSEIPSIASKVEGNYQLSSI